MGLKKIKNMQYTHDLDPNKSSWINFELIQGLENPQFNTRKQSELALRSLLKALDLRDNYTYGHSIRVAHYCLILGSHLLLNPNDLYELELSGLFHDIGKIGIPDHILCKPTGLSSTEFSIMKQHPVMSYEILKNFKNFESISINTKHHHERFDGKGYPEGLQGEAIPLFSRIILIADTFDAITSSRVYRVGKSQEIAFQELLEFSGSQFDPTLVRHFISGMREFTADLSENTSLKANTLKPEENNVIILEKKSA